MMKSDADLICNDSGIALGEIHHHLFINGYLFINKIFNLHSQVAKPFSWST